MGAVPGPPSPVWSKSPRAPSAAPSPPHGVSGSVPTPQARPGRRVGALQRVCHSRRAPSSPLLPLSNALPAGPKERIQPLALLPNQEPANGFLLEGEAQIGMDLLGSFGDGWE